MKILETVTIYFEGKQDSNAISTVPFYMMDDKDERFFVHIPKIPIVLDAFRWMNDSNVLGDLIELAPTFTVNDEEVQKVVDRNERAFQIASASGALQTYMDPKTYYTPTTTWPGKMPVPDLTWRVEWTFWKPESAVLLKLAIPGAKCDTLK